MFRVFVSSIKTRFELKYLSSCSFSFLIFKFRGHHISHNTELLKTHCPGDTKSQSLSLVFICLRVGKSLLKAS